MEYLDEPPSPMPSFFPQNVSERVRVRKSLALEDSLHMDLRTITMGFLVPYVLAKKLPKVLEAYEKSGAPDPGVYQARQRSCWVRPSVDDLAHRKGQFRL